MSQRNDSEYSGSSSQPTGALGDQDHAGNSEFEKHDLKTGTMYCFCPQVKWNVDKQSCIPFVGEIL